MSLWLNLFFIIIFSSLQPKTERGELQVKTYLKSCTLFSFLYSLTQGKGHATRDNFFYVTQMTGDHISKAESEELKDDDFRETSLC